MLAFEDEGNALKTSACIASWHGQRSGVDCPGEVGCLGPACWLSLGVFRKDIERRWSKCSVNSGRSSWVHRQKDFVSPLSDQESKGKETSQKALVIFLSAGVTES